VTDVQAADYFFLKKRSVNFIRSLGTAHHKFLEEGFGENEGKSLEPTDSLGGIVGLVVAELGYPAEPAFT
jgi:hypothetical protein